MIQGVVIFVLFLGPLVFFHELGHFLFAKFFGVKVETFSIGFGPKLLKFKRGDTDYALSLIPLGGYVKMFGDDPTREKELSPEDQKIAFNYKTKWQRFWIVFGGPLANFILAFVIYFLLQLSGGKVPEPKLGFISESSNYYKIGLRTGDILSSINETEIESFDDLNTADSLITKVGVVRNSKNQSFTLNMPFEEFVKGIASLEPRFMTPVVVGENGLLYLISNSKIADKDVSIEQIKDSKRFYIFDAKGDSFVEQHTRVIEGKDLFDALQSNNLHTKDLRVASIIMSSAADKAGIIKNDIIIKVAGSNVNSFNDLRAIVQASKGQSIDFEVIRSGVRKLFKIKPEQKTNNDLVYYSIGVYSDAEFIPLKMVDLKPKGLVNSIVGAWHKTVEGLAKTVSIFKKLVTAEVSMNNLGGPLAIGKVAKDSFNISLSYFFKLMALISINLGVINLFPIPVLDGGHIVFLVFEFFNKGPLSKRKLQVAQQFGLSFLLLFMTVAIFNDISRMFF